MKLKQVPEDFVVEETLRDLPAASGPFTLYRLEKTGLDTLEVVRTVARLWRVPRRDVAFAGLKDRHARTVQTLSIRRGPQRSLRREHFHLEPSGRAARAVHRGDLLENRFAVRLRDLSQEEVQRLAERARRVGRRGFANYYDDQRFGSARGTGGRLVAEALLHGRAEEALRLAIATPSSMDRGRLLNVRRKLRDRWGRWGALARDLGACPERRVVHALAEGRSFEQAYERLDPDLRSLHGSALQAAIFNDGLRRAAGDGPRHPGIAGPYVFFDRDPGPWAETKVPLAEGKAEAHPLLDAALEARGLDREMLARLPLRRGLRALIAHPSELEVHTREPDRLNQGRYALRLCFGLGSGSYATMLVKCITHDMKPRERSRKGSKGKRRRR